MEVIRIKEKNVNTIIYLDNKNYYGCRYLDNDIKSIDNLNILRVFFLSKDYIKLPNQGKYDVYLYSLPYTQ